MRSRLFIALITLTLSSALIPQPAAPTSAPATNPAAQAVLDHARDAYANIKSLELVGKISIDGDVAAQKEQHSESFSAWYQAPGKFRHEMKDDMVIVGTGEKLFSFDKPHNLYMTDDEPKERTSDLPAGAGEVLREQNPSLILALSANASDELTSGSSVIEKLADVQLDGQRFEALKFAKPDRDITMLFNPDTGLLRQMQVDLRKLFEQQRAPQINKALLTIDYSATIVNGAIDASHFAFTPPAGATLIDEKAAMAAAQDDEPAQALVGKRAPEIKLENLDGKEISPLTESKGSVIVIDFWATWCPQCLDGLPHLDQLYKDKQSAGLKVLAVNLREDKDKINQFLKSNHITLPVLLDYNGDVAARYLVDPLPQTVVIGKDGKVRKIFIGFVDGSGEKLAAEVESAMKSR